MNLTTGSGLRISTGKSIGQGGQAEIYSINGNNAEVVKKYFPDALRRDVRLVRRLDTMIAHQPQWRDQQGHPILAWPTDTAYDRGNFVGFTMPRVDLATTVELHAVTNMSTRLEPDRPGWLRSFGWRYHVQTALNLARAVNTIHQLGGVIGDFNERNARVSSSALVTLLDCDSMQIANPESGELFLCGVGRPEWNPPELAGVNWATTPRRASSDLFGLAIHIYQILLRGEHPFRGSWSGRGDKPDVSNLAAQGIWVGSNGPLSARPNRVGLTALPHALATQFATAFADGAAQPARRPTAADWMSTLGQLAINLADCRSDPSHQYLRSLPTCPWCSATVAAASRPSGYSQPSGCGQPSGYSHPPENQHPSVPPPPPPSAPPSYPPPPPAPPPVYLPHSSYQPQQTRNWGVIGAWIAALLAVGVIVLCFCCGPISSLIAPQGTPSP